MRFADDAEHGLLGLFGDERLYLGDIQAARLGNARCLQKSRLGAQIGIEPRGASGDQVGG